MRFESRKGQNEEKWKKKKCILQLKKTYFLYCSFFAWFFGFAFEI
jgi:hypothetical protein